MNRFFQILLIGSVLVLSWLGMMIVHEFGHVLNAWISRGEVSKVVLHPLEFSRTDLARNPHSLFVAWGGAIIGTVLPLVILGLVKSLRLSSYYLFQFFAGFCLVVNGIYLAVVSFLKAADPGDLMRHGTPQWMLIFYGVVAFPLGLFLWNGLGVHFGFGKAQGAVDRKTSVGTFVCVLLVIAVEFVVGSR